MKMSSYENNFEDVPLVVTTAYYERSQRKRYKRNVAISLGLVVSVVIVIIVVVSVSPLNQNAPNGIDGENNSLRLEGPTTYSQDNGTLKKSPIVRVKQGRLQGIILKSRKGREYNFFYSIPYGKAPVKELRFEPAQPAESWEEAVYDSTYARTQCPSRDKTKENAILGSEDCLHVHIATPKLPGRRDRAALPVIFYIYGGAFKGGYAWRFDPKYFMDEDVVIVLVDYRTGALGHLNTGDGVIGGNLSLKDQSLALRWVRDNIKAFGGDPDKVLLNGNSAGSMSVHAHLLSEMSRGLFRGAISQSGVSLGSNFPDVFLNDPGSIARRLGEEMNCPEVSDTQELAKCLKEADLVTLVNVNRPDIPWGLTGETIPANGDTSQMFFKDKPINIMRKGDFAKVPWIVGVNSAEQFTEAYELLQDQDATDTLNKDWATLILENIIQVSPDDDWVDEQVRQLYFNGSSKITRDDRYALTDLISDRKYVHPTRTAGMLHSKHSPVYFYYFTKESNFSLYDEKKYDFPPPYGVGHADELQYLLLYSRYPEVTLNDSRMPFSEDFVKIWVSFAYNLVPDPLVSEPWNPIEESQDGLIWFQLNEKPLRKNIEPFTERMKFWDKLVSERNLYG